MKCSSCNSPSKSHKSGKCSDCRRDGFKERSLAIWDDADAKAAWAKSCTFKPRSALNQQVETLLTRLNIHYITEHVIGPWSFDVFIPHCGLLIECQGEYWHTVSRKERADRAKATYVESYTKLRLLEVWEVEFYKQGRLEYLVKRALGLLEVPPQSSVDFTKLDCRVVDRRDASQLYGSSHYLGSCRGRWHFGLYLGDLLIGACSFGQFQRNEQTLKYEGASELTRFCIDSAYQVKNLGSWFLSRSLKLIGGTVVTYADRTQGHDGALYKATNFTFSHEVPSDYHYVDPGGWVLHKKTVWNRSVSMKMTEAEYAAKHELSKKWGAAKLCFIFTGTPARTHKNKPPVLQPRKVVSEVVGKVAQPVLDVALIQQLKLGGTSAGALATQFSVSRAMIFHTVKLRLVDCHEHGKLWSKKDSCPKCRAVQGSKAGGKWVKDAMS